MEPLFKEDNFLIISNDDHFNLLQEIAKKISIHFKNKKIIFKLHPEQYSKKFQIKKYFINYKNIFLDSGEEDLKQLFLKCDYVVGIRSSVLYLAIQARKNVFILNSPFFPYEKRLSNFVNIFNSSEQLIDQIENSKIIRNKNKLTVVERFDKINLINLIDNLI